jgi:hypothetical protein
MLPFTVDDVRWFEDELARLDTPEGRREIYEEEYASPRLVLDPDLAVMRSLSDGSLWQRQVERNVSRRIDALRQSLRDELAKVKR